MDVAADIRICTVYVTLKESVRNFTRVLSAWDSGSATVLAATNLLMLTLAGTQCPGSTWNNYLTHNLNINELRIFCPDLKNN